MDVAEQLELLADLLEIEGEASFRVLAYRRAATRIRETAGSVAELALAGRAKELQGIGKTIEEKIVQVIEDGEMHALTKRKSEVPVEVAGFMRLPGLGPKTAARIWRELGVETLDELKAAAESERLRTLAGLGPKSEEKILAALAYQAESPRRTASSRIATLCSFEPVKCCSRFPYDSGGTTRRSKRSPSLERTVAFVGPFATTSITHLSFVK